MDSLLAQRLIASLEANTAAQYRLASVLEAHADEGGEDMVSLTKAAKILGLSLNYVRNQVFRKHWPSEGTGRNRKISLKLVRQKRRDEATPHLHVM